MQLFSDRWVNIHVFELLRGTSWYQRLQEGGLIALSFLKWLTNGRGSKAVCDPCLVYSPGVNLVEPIIV